MKIGLSTMIFGKKKRFLTIDEAKKINETGLKYIELSYSHDVDDKVISYFEKNNITIISYHAEHLEIDISSSNNILRQNGVQDAKRKIDRIKDIGGEIIVIHPGGWCSDEREKDARLKNSISSLVEIGKYANSRKIKVAIENLPMEFLGDDPEILKKILISVRDETGLNKEIGICLDTGHANLTKSLYKNLEIFSKDIITMHLQDNIGDNLNDRSLAKDDIHIPPGQGQIEWKKLLGKLEKKKYAGSLIFELRPGPIKGKDHNLTLDAILKFIRSEDYFKKDKVLI
jgi:sugar phosphate isomerase/epimerase